MFLMMKNTSMLFFALLSPVTLVGNYISSKSQKKRLMKQKQQEYDDEVRKIDEEVEVKRKNELEVVRNRYRTPDELILWSKHIEDDNFMTMITAEA